MNNSPQNKKVNFDMLKLIEWAVSFLFLAVILLMITGFFPVSHPLITRYAYSLIERSSLDSCSIGKVKLTLWKGISLYDVSTTEKTDGGLEYRLQLSKIRIGCNVLSTALKWQKIKAELQQLHINFWQTAKDDPYTAVDQLLRYASQSEEIKNIYINGKNLSVNKNGNSLITANRFSFDITREKEITQNIQINLEAAEFIYLRHVFTFLRADGLYDNRILKISKCRGRVLDGKVKIDADLDLVNKLISNLNVSASHLNIEQIVYEAGGMQGCISGEMDFDFNSVSSFMEPDSIRGKGIIRAYGVNIEATPVQLSIVKMLENPMLGVLSFSKIKTDFEIIGNDSILADISGNGEMLDFRANGQINLHGGINQLVNASFSEDAIKELPGFIVNSLDLNENNRRTVRCRIYGTIDSPIVELDREILKNAIGNVFEQMKENFIDLFRKK